MSDQLITITRWRVRKCSKWSIRLNLSPEEISVWHAACLERDLEELDRSNRLLRGYSSNQVISYFCHNLVSIRVFFVGSIRLNLSPEAISVWHAACLQKDLEELDRSNRLLRGYSSIEVISYFCQNLVSIRVFFSRIDSAQSQPRSNFGMACCMSRRRSRGAWSI